jgi:methionyl-tRNA formyltransferase
MWLARQLSTVCELAGLVRESKPPVSRKETVLQDSVVVEYFRDRTDRESFYFRSGDNIENSVPCLDLSWGESNSDSVMDFIDAYNPDVIVVFGSSLIKEPLIKRFQGRMINMHLGLSPYYRGSSTNFWPLVDGKPECVGVTLHHVTKKIDGGMIILQARPVMAVNDTSHDIGCKTIMAGAECFNRIFSDFDRKDRKSTRLNSSHNSESRMPSSA